jgi:cytoskeleton protein RodZ
MKDLGEFLKTERLRQGVELATITEQTCISRSMLIALEEGDASKIGTPLLVRSFTRAYCRILRIDPSTVLERYTGEIPRHERLDDGIRRFRESSQAARHRGRLRLIMVTMALITLGAVYYTTISLPRRDAATVQLNPGSADSDQGMADVAAPIDVVTPSEEEDKTVPNLTVLGPSGVAPPVAGGAGSSSAQGERRGVEAAVNGQPGTAAEAPQAGHRLRVEALQESWVEVRLDDKKVEGVLIPKGKSRDWKVSKGLRLQLGNAGTVKVYWDGKRLKHLGKAGQSVRLRLPEDASKL